MNADESFQNRLYGLALLALLAQGDVLSGSPVIDCNILGSTAIRPSRLGYCICCWKVTIAVYVNATILGKMRLVRRIWLVSALGRLGCVVGRGSIRKGESFRA